MTWIACISLHQPWASLVAAHVKRYETRHWVTPRRLVGERIAIHAALKPVKVSHLDPELVAVCNAAFGEGWALPGRLPLGAFVCTARLGRPRSTNAFQPIRYEEMVSGNYGPERWAWALEDVQVLPQPISAKGHQSLWRVPMGDLELVA